MRIHRTMKRLVLLWFVLAISAWATPPSQAADQLVEGVMILAPVGESGGMAYDAAEDTLKACLARISVMATAGQRMLAQQNCEGEETFRKLIPFAPDFQR